MLGSLSQRDIFPQPISKALPERVNRPEQVNFVDPPAKLLDRIYKQQTKKGYKKTTYGRQLFARLDPLVAADKCPYLRQLLDEMLKLAKTAGL